MHCSNKQFFTLWLGVIVSCSAFGQKIDLGGFVSQGLVHTTANTFFDSKDETSYKMTEIGLQASYVTQENFRLSGQAIYRNWGDIESTYLDYLFIDYGLYSRPTVNLSLRLGRIKSDYGLYNATRDIPSARPSIFLPQSVYLDILRNSSTSYDGVSFYGNTLAQYGTWNWAASYGINPVDDALTESIFGGALQGDFDTHKSTKLNVSWESSNGNWLLGLGFEDQQVDFEPVNAPNAPIIVSPGFIEYERYIFSSQYFAPNWDLTLEYIYLDSSTAGFEFFAPNLPVELQPQPQDFVQSTNVSDGGYVQYRYLLSEQLTLLLRYDVFFRDTDNRSGEITDAGGIIGQDFGAFAKDLTGGIKWQINERWIVQAEAHFVEGTGYISPWVDVIPTVEDKYWEMFALQASYSF